MSPPPRSPKLDAFVPFYYGTNAVWCRNHTFERFCCRTFPEIPSVWCQDVNRTHSVFALRTISHAWRTQGIQQFFLCQTTRTGKHSRYSHARASTCRASTPKKRAQTRETNLRSCERHAPAMVAYFPNLGEKKNAVQVRPGGGGEKFPNKKMWLICHRIFGVPECMSPTSSSVETSTSTSGTRRMQFGRRCPGGFKFRAAARLVGARGGGLAHMLLPEHEEGEV